LPGQPPGYWGGTPPNWIDNTLPGNQPGIDNTLPGSGNRPMPPIYLPDGGHVMPPIAPGGEPTHPIEIPPGSWVLPPQIDNSLPGSQPGIDNTLPPVTPQPKG
jgi:hypothetical protein